MSRRPCAGHGIAIPGDHLSNLRSIVPGRTGIVLDGCGGLKGPRKRVGHAVRVRDMTDFGGLRERIPSNMSRSLFRVVDGCVGAVGISEDAACH